MEAKKELLVKGFEFNGIHYPVNGQVTILVGSHLSGKTTLLENLENSQRKAARLVGRVSFPAGFEIRSTEILETVHKLCGFSQILDSRQLHASSNLRRLTYMLDCASDSDIKLLLIDDIEQGLHIEAQKKLIAALLEINPNLQLVVSTHSPAIIIDGWRDCVINLPEFKPHF